MLTGMLVAERYLDPYRGVSPNRQLSGDFQVLPPPHLQGSSTTGLCPAEWIQIRATLVSLIGIPSTAAGMRLDIIYAKDQKSVAEFRIVRLVDTEVLESSGVLLLLLRDRASESKRCRTSGDEKRTNEHDRIRNEWKLYKEMAVMRDVKRMNGKCLKLDEGCLHL